MMFTSKIEQIPPWIHFRNHRFYVFCNYMFIFSFFGHLLFVPIFYWIGSTVVLTINIIAVFVDVFALMLNYKGFIKTAPAVWVFWIYLHTLNCMFYFGWEQGYYYYLLTLVIIVFFAGWSIGMRFFVTGILCVTTLIMFQYTHIHLPFVPLENSAHHFMHAANAIANFLAISYAAFYYHKYAQQMEEKLLQLAHTDALTGIFNRRYFEQSVNESTQARTKENALLLLDIDYFKNINDTYGHAVGDQAIKKVADICVHSIRDVDLLGRVGGEEFAIFLIGVDYTEALQIAERIRSNIEKCGCQVDDDIQIAITASIGLSIPQSKNEDFSAMMVRADKALYEAKKGGRNKVVANV